MLRLVIFSLVTKGEIKISKEGGDRQPLSSEDCSILIHFLGNLAININGCRGRIALQRSDKGREKCLHSLLKNSLFSLAKSSVFKAPSTEYLRIDDFSPPLWQY